MIPVIDACLRLYMYLIIVRVVLSWLSVDMRNSFFKPVATLTDPLLVPLSRLVPPLGGVLDISPMIALVIIWILRRVLAGMV